jgi:hypothetical protein
VRGPVTPTELTQWRGVLENVRSTLRTLTGFKGVADRLRVPQPGAHALQLLQHGVQA